MQGNGAFSSSSSSSQSQLVKSARFSDPAPEVAQVAPTAARRPKAATAATAAIAKDTIQLRSYSSSSSSSRQAHRHDKPCLQRLQLEQRHSADDYSSSRSIRLPEVASKKADSADHQNDDCAADDCADRQSLLLTKQTDRKARAALRCMLLIGSLFNATTDAYFWLANFDRIPIELHVFLAGSMLTACLLLLSILPSFARLRLLCALCLLLLFVCSVVFHYVLAILLYFLLLACLFVLLQLEPQFDTQLDTLFDNLHAATAASPAQQQLLHQMIEQHSVASATSSSAIAGHQQQYEEIRPVQSSRSITADQTSTTTGKAGLTMTAAAGEAAAAATKEQLRRQLRPQLETQLVPSLHNSQLKSQQQRQQHLHH